MLRRLLVSWLVICSLTLSTCFGVDFFVSPEGNDDWSGRLPEANADRSDGPKRSLTGTQIAWRTAIREKDCDSVRVFLRGGTWYGGTPLELNATDRSVPLSIETYSGEKVVLLGSRPLESLRSDANGILHGTVSLEKGVEPFRPGRLFCGTTPLIRARYPNADPHNPIYGGFLYVERGFDPSVPFVGSVGQIHNAGDTLFYSINPPEDGEYTIWTFYGANNAMYKMENVDGRMSFQYNNDQPVPMVDTANTGKWTPGRWSRSAVITLKKGKGTLQWKNNKGGGIQLGGFVLSADPSWSPVGKSKSECASNPTILVIPADMYTKSIGLQVSCSSNGSKASFRFKPGELKPEWATPDVELKIFQSGSCRAYQEIAGIESITSESPNHFVVLNGKELTATLGLGDRYYLENHPSFLDAPGEWFFDRATGRISIVPPREAEKEYRYAVDGTLIRIVGTPNEKVAPVRISGLTFGETAFTRDEGCVAYSMGRYGVIQLDRTSGVTVERCNFFNIGRYAVAVDQGGSNAVTRCNIERSAQGGVMLRGTKGNMVADCYIRFLGSEYKHIGGIVLDGAGTSDNIVEHNYISDSSRYGITLKNVATNNKVLFNDVWSTSLETNDSGAIEVTQQEKTFRSNSVIANNRVVKTNGYSTSGKDGTILHNMSWGIYLDSFAGGYLVENNYVCDTGYGGFMLQGGQGNTVRNNIFRNAEKFQGFFANYLRNFKDIIFEKNIMAWTNAKAGFMIQGAGLLPEFVVCRDNLFKAPAEIDPNTDSRCQAWLKNKINTNSVFADPMFLHPEKHDGLLDSNSPAFKFGFKQLDLSTVGPRK